MIAVKGSYENGVITLLEPLPQNLKKAELNIVVLPTNENIEANIPVGKFGKGAIESEEEFKSLAIHSFLDTDDDKEIDWEDCFGLK